MVVLKVPNMAGNSNASITREFLNEVGVNNRKILVSIVFTMTVCVNSEVLLVVSFF